MHIWVSPGVITWELSTLNFETRSVTETQGSLGRVDWLDLGSQAHATTTEFSHGFQGIELNLYQQSQISSALAPVLVFLFCLCWVAWRVVTIVFRFG